MNEREKYRRAKQQVEAMTTFYIHAGCFVLVMTVLLFVNLLASSVWWVQWPFLGWGVFLAAHGLVVFSEIPNFIRNWQLRKIKELSRKM